MGEAGSFLMELLKIASISQIRSIKILPVSVAGRQRDREREGEMPAILTEKDANAAAGT